MRTTQLSRRHSPGRSWRRSLLAAAALTLTLAACGQGGDGESLPASAGDTSFDRAAVGAGGAAAPQTGRGSPERADTPARTPNRTTVQTRAVIRRGEVSLVTPEMAQARTRIDELLDRHGGYLAREDTGNDRDGRPERSVLVLRVPEASFAEVMDALTDIGRTTSATRSSEDVTTEVIDVDARVATQRASIERLRGFLRQATDVDDMIRLESEIATRQAELESMEAQQSYLRDRTTMSTITVRLHSADAPVPVRDDDSGFLAGLAAGWTALTTVLVGLATVAGAVVPFVVSLALVALPLLWLARSLRRRRAGSGAPTAPVGDPG